MNPLKIPTYNLRLFGSLILTLNLVAFLPPITQAETTLPQCVAPSPLFTSKANQPLFEPGTRKRQTTYNISPKTANKLLADKTALLIDVRDWQAFQRYRIPGSLNIPPHTLKTKTFLKSKHLILLNEGHSYHQLEKLVLTLKSAGFRQLSILEGGLNQWLKHKGPLLGDLLAPSEIQKMIPAQFWPERNYQHWLVIYISPTHQQQLSPSVLNLSPAGDTKIFIEQLTQAIAKRTQAGISPYLLIISAQGKDYPKVQASLRDYKWPNVFYLHGGLQAYQQFLDQQTAVNTYIPTAQTKPATPCGNPLKSCQP